MQRPSFDRERAVRLDRCGASDAEPVFAAAGSVARAGVLLAIPGIEASGAVEVARVVYGARALAPAFYGLRTTIVALLLLALLRIKRPEALKEHAPSELGRLLGLDRAPEVKTLRKKLAQLAAQGLAERFGRELAQRCSGPGYQDRSRFGQAGPLSSGNRDHLGSGKRDRARSGKRDQ